jgi:glucokinase
MLLVGDIGGTHARLALVSAEHGPVAPVLEARLPSRDYPDVEALLADFVARAPVDAPPIARAVLAVAGPVVDGRAQLTNLPWSLEEGAIAAALRTDGHAPRVRLINDLVALAAGVTAVPAEGLHTLQAGIPAPRGAVAVVAPGTGLGEAMAVHDGTGYDAIASEGGHADFAPSDALQTELVAWLRAEDAALPADDTTTVRFDGHVSYERVCSGRALPTLYAFHRARGTAPESPALAARLAAASDPTPVIVDAGLRASDADALCQATLALFVDVLAAEAGNAALRVLATGGVFLGGGMPRRVLPLLARPAFVARFRQKGRMSDLLARIPLHVVVQSSVALVGAAQVALADAARGR